MLSYLPVSHCFVMLFCTKTRGLFGVEVEIKRLARDIQKWKHKSHELLDMR